MCVCVCVCVCVCLESVVCGEASRREPGAADDAAAQPSASASPFVYPKSSTQILSFFFFFFFPLRRLRYTVGSCETYKKKHKNKKNERIQAVCVCARAAATIAMGNVQSCAGPAGHPRRRTGVRRDWDKAPDSTKMTVLQRSKLAAWQSAHPNPLRLVLGVDLPDAMPEDVAEIKHALDEYAKDPTGEVQFSGSDLADEDGAGGSDGALSRLHGADFSDRDDSDSSDDRYVSESRA